MHVSFCSLRYCFTARHVGMYRNQRHYVLRPRAVQLPGQLGKPGPPADRDCRYDSWARLLHSCSASRFHSPLFQMDCDSLEMEGGPPHCSCQDATYHCDGVQMALLRGIPQIETGGLWYELGPLCQLQPPLSTSRKKKLRDEVCKLAKSGLCTFVWLP